MSESPDRPGFALPLVLAALVLAGVLAAGAVMAAGQGMRDAAGAVARAQAGAAAERALLLATTTEWDSTWAAPGPPGLVGGRTHAGGGAGEGDAVRVIRLDADHFLVIVDARAGGIAPFAARTRLALTVALDAARRPRALASHAWSPMP